MVRYRSVWALYGIVLQLAISGRICTGQEGDGVPAPTQKVLVTSLQLKGNVSGKVLPARQLLADAVACFARDELKEAKRLFLSVAALKTEEEAGAMFYLTRIHFTEQETESAERTLSKLVPLCLRDVQLAGCSTFAGRHSSILRLLRSLRTAASWWPVAAVLS